MSLQYNDTIHELKASIDSKYLIAVSSDRYDATIILTTTRHATDEQKEAIHPPCLEQVSVA